MDLNLLLKYFKIVFSKLIPTFLFTFNIIHDYIPYNFVSFSNIFLEIVLDLLDLTNNPNEILILFYIIKLDLFQNLVILHKNSPQLVMLLKLLVNSSEHNLVLCPALIDYMGHLVHLLRLKQSDTLVLENSFTKQSNINIIQPI